MLSHEWKLQPGLNENVEGSHTCFNDLGSLDERYGTVDSEGGVVSEPLSAFQGTESGRSTEGLQIENVKVFRMEKQ